LYSFEGFVNFHLGSGNLMAAYFGKLVEEYK
jgi:hypothetical protein